MNTSFKYTNKTKILSGKVDNVLDGYLVYNILEKVNVGAEIYKIVF